MSEFNYYKADVEYGTLFYQFPRVLMNNKKYEGLSDGAKLAYMIFKDRLAYSIRNNWFDEDYNIYFIFTNDEICQLLGKSKPTAIKIKKELEKVGLLRQVNMGFDIKNAKQRPNRLYLADLEVEATDIYTYQNLQKVGTSEGKDSLPTDPSEGKNSLPSKTKDNIINSASKVDSSEGKDSLPTDPSEGKESLLDLEELSTKDIKDIKEISKTDKTDLEMISNSFQSKEKDADIEQQVINDYIEEQGLYLLFGEKLIDRMKMFSFNDFDTFTTFINKLEFAQKSVEKEAEITLPIYEGSKYFEFIEQELLRTFNRAIHQHRFGKVNNIASYLFISFKNVFEDLATTIKEETSNTTV